MKTKLFKILIIILFVCLSTNAQKQNHNKTYKEEFTTNKDVVIDVNTRSTDVQIETWNKNKVSIEAIIEIEGVEGEIAEKTIENWQFNAVGNKSEIEITSKSNQLFSSFINDNGVKKIIVNGKQIDMPEGDFNLTLPATEMLEKFQFFKEGMSFSEIPEFPTLPEFPEISESPVVIDFDFQFENKLPKFDYEKYKKDKSYLEKWQKEMEENLEKNKVKWEKNAENAKEHTAVLKVELEKMAQQHKKQAEKRKIIMKKQMAEHKVHAKKREKQIILRKKDLAKRKVDVEKKREIIIGVLADREKVKVKRTIIIKAPKDAKFKMNVKYGTISFPN